MYVIWYVLGYPLKKILAKKLEQKQNGFFPFKTHTNFQKKNIIPVTKSESGVVRDVLYQTSGRTDGQTE